MTCLKDVLINIVLENMILHVTVVTFRATVVTNETAKG